MKTYVSIIYAVILIVLFDSSSSSMLKKYWVVSHKVSQIELTEFHQTSDMVLGFSEHNLNPVTWFGEKEVKNYVSSLFILFNQIKNKVLQNFLTQYQHFDSYRITDFSVADIIFPFHYFW